MELYRIRSVFGYGEIAWSFRQWILHRKSVQWPRTTGTIEGYELLLARDNGWFVVFYSYTFGGETLSGEWRKWLLFTFSSQEKLTQDIIDRFPIGTHLGVRVDPSESGRSVAEL